MEDIRSACKCTNLAAAKWVGPKKNMVIVLAVMLFGIYSYLPMVKAAVFFHEPLPISTFVFYFSFFRMQVLNGGLCVLMFSDILILDGFTLWEIQRSGRRSYILGLIFFAFAAGAIYTLLHVIISLIITSPALTFSNDWGKILSTWSSNPSQIMQRIEISTNTAVDIKILDTLNPLSALSWSVIMLWLTTSFMGMIQLFFSVYIDRMSGIIVSGVLISLVVFSLFLGQLSVGRWLFFISPLSWCNIAVLDWYQTGELPSPGYAVTILAAGSVILAVLSVIRFTGKDTV